MTSDLDVARDDEYVTGEQRCWVCNRLTVLPLVDGLCDVCRRKMWTRHPLVTVPRWRVELYREDGTWLEGYCYWTREAAERVAAGFGSRARVSEI